MNIIEAIKQNNIKLVKELIKVNANVNLQDEDGSSALIWASYNGNIKIVKKLIKVGANINLQDNNEYTALICASRSGHIKIVKKLIKANCNIDQKFIETIGKYNINILKLLINKDFNIALEYVKKFNKQKDLKYYTKLLVTNHINNLNIFQYEKGLINIILNYYILI